MKKGYMINEQVKQNIKIVLDYLWHDEEKHYQELGGFPKEHIFRVLKKLAKDVGHKHESRFK